MDIYPKFILEVDDEQGLCLIISKCTYHKELVTDETKVRGGGWFTIKDKVMTFYGDSSDFGEAKLEDIKEAIDNDNVYTNPYLTDSIAKDYKFMYRTKTEVITFN